MPLLKYIISFVILVVLVIPDYKVSAEELDFNQIEQEVCNYYSKFYYEILAKRYRAGDTLSDEEFKYLYYGFIFQDEYMAYEKPEIDKYLLKLKKKEEFNNDSLAIIFREFIQKSDLNILLSLYYLKIIENTLFNAKDFISAQQIRKRFDRIVDLVRKYGDGKTCESAFVVLSVSDEYTFLNILGYEPAGEQALVIGCDALSVLSNSDSMNVVFFSTFPMFFGMQLAMMRENGIEYYTNDSTDANYWLRKADEVQYMKPEKALEYLETALKIDSNHIRALNLKGELLSSQKEYDKALEVFNYGYFHLNYVKIFTYNKAITHSHLEQYDSAVKYIRIILNRYPHSKKVNINLADILTKQNKFDDALIIVDKLLLDDLDDDDRYNTLIIKTKILSHQNKIDDMNKCFNEAFAIKPFDLDNINSLGLEILYSGKYRESIPFFDKILSIYGSSTNALNNKGLALLRLNKYDSAFIYFKKCIEIDSSYAMVYYNLSCYYYDKNKLDSALWFINKSLNFNNNYSYSWELKARIEKSLQKNAKSLESDQMAYKLNPNKRNLKNMALSYIDIGNAKQAIKYYDSLLTLDNSQDDIWADKGIALNSMKYFTKAQKCFDRAVELKPDNPYYWELCGENACDLKNYKASIYYFEKTIQLGRKSSSIYFYQSLNYIGLNELDKAMEAVDKSLEIDYNNSNTWCNKARIYSYQNMNDSALCCLHRSLSISKTIYNLNELGIFYLHKGEYDSAASYFKEIFKINKNSYFANINLSVIYNDKHKFDSALIYANKAIDLSPDAFSWITKGKILYNLNRFDESLTCFDSAQKSDNSYTAYYLHKSKSYYKLNDFQKADSLSLLYVQWNSKDPEGYYNRAIILSKSNSKKEIIENIRKAVLLDSDYGHKIMNTPEFRKLIDDGEIPFIFN